MVSSSIYDLDASVIIPVFNQKDALLVTLSHFVRQDYSRSRYEIIVVDDGSTDGLMQYAEENSGDERYKNVRFIHQENQGRSAARNNGVSAARGRRLIFCDADRFPARNFVRCHTDWGLDRSGTAVVGCPLDYFGRLESLSSEADVDFQKIRKFSRIPIYYKKVMSIFDSDGYTDSKIAWISFLVGNSSIDNEDFQKSGGFDKDFKFWGFEHFELALRLQEQGLKFRSIPEISNFHIPHPRGDGFYMQGIENSIELLKKKHKELDFDSFKGFFTGELPLQEFELRFGGTLSEKLQALEPIFFKTQ
jgi:glycosyltransferase involved in cell wall biosynthesis